MYSSWLMRKKERKKEKECKGIESEFVAVFEIVRKRMKKRSLLRKIKGGNKEMNT